MDNLLLLIIVSFIFNSTIAAIISGLIKFLLFKKLHVYNSLLGVGLKSTLAGLTFFWIIFQLIKFESIAIYFLVFLIPTPFVLVGLVIQAYRLTIHLRKNSDSI